MGCKFKIRVTFKDPTPETIQKPIRRRVSIDVHDDINIEKFSLGKGSLSEKKDRLEHCVK